MPRPRAPFLSACTVLLLATSAHARTADQTWNRSFQVSRHPIVRIETRDAHVTVHGWKEAKVSVRVVSRGRATGLFVGHRRPVVDIAQEGNGVRVRARFEGSESGLLVVSSSRMEVEVWQPTESDLEVQSADGPVNLEELSGQVSVESSDGAITGRDLKGNLDVHSNDGHVILDDVDGSLTLETHDGRSEVRGRFEAVSVETSDGGIDFEARPGSRIGHGWSLRSSDGHIHLRIPRDLSATLDARSRDGGVTVDMPVRVQGRSDRNELMGDLNGGGSTLRLRTSDGSIRIEPAD